MSLANLGRSIATAALSQFAMSMGATSGPIWWPMVMPGPSSDIAATMSMKNAKLQRCGPAYTVTHANPRGSGAPRSDRSDPLAHHVDWAVLLPLILCRRRRPIGLLLGRNAPINASHARRCELNSRYEVPSAAITRASLDRRSSLRIGSYRPSRFRVSFSC